MGLKQGLNVYSAKLLEKLIIIHALDETIF